MSEAFVVDAVRTPVGRRGGGLAGAHPADLGAHVILSPVGRTGDLVAAGGVQNMSQIPIAAAMTAGQAFGHDDPFGGSDGWRARYGGQEISQFRAADLIAAKSAIGRAEMERYALASHQRAIAATDAGDFAAEIEPYGDVRADECPRRDTSLGAMAGLVSLRPEKEGGVVTAALSSQIADGAAALLIASQRAVTEHGLRPAARTRHISARGDDPVLMLTAPIAATEHALRKAGLTLADIDLIEINEAFAPVVLAWQRETGADLSRMNVSGGAIALGHPFGATGARLMTTLLHGLRRTGGRLGLQTMCEGGGQANVTIIERVS